MKIAVIGLGGIGSTFAFHLARAGHEVTAVARGHRLGQLERDGEIVTAAGARAAVTVAAVLDATTAWDLVLVTVLAHQLDPLLPALAACRARSVMFMFNTFAPLASLREVVGEERFAFGFPSILARVDAGRLHARVVTRGMPTIVSDPAWARVFTDAGVPAVVEPDMEAWLRCHAALVVPVMLASVAAYRGRRGISWSEALALARAMAEGLDLVRRLGHAIRPAPVATFARAPRPALAGLLWALSRLPAIRQAGAAGDAEARALLDAMIAAAPAPTPALRAIRP